MYAQHTPSIPLIGALLVAEGCLSAEQLEASLLVQQQDHPGLSLAEVLVRCGYITQAQLSRALAAQQELRESVGQAVGHRAPSPADLVALVVAPAANSGFARHLLSLGVDSYFAGGADALRSLAASVSPDLVLVDPRSVALAAEATLPPETLLSILPLPLEAWHDDTEVVEQAHAILAHYLGQARSHAARIRAHEELRQREYEMRILDTLIREVSNAPARSALGVLMAATRDIIGVEAGTIFQLDRETDELIFSVVLGPSQNALQRRRLPSDRGIAGWVVRHGEPLLVPDTRRDSRFEHGIDRRTGFETRSVLCVPLRAHGEIWGVIQLINKLEGTFTERDLQILRIVGAVGGLLQELDTRAGLEREVAFLDHQPSFDIVAA